MIEVEVLYVGNTRVCVPYEERDTLSLAAVLGLAVRESDVEGKKRNIVVAHGFDNYALCERTMNGQPWIDIYSWDDGDFVWRRTSNHLDIDARVQADVPLGCMHMIFRGQQVPDTDWKEALRILDEEIF